MDNVANVWGSFTNAVQNFWGVKRNRIITICVTVALVVIGVIAGGYKAWADNENQYEGIVVSSNDMDQMSSITFHIVGDGAVVSQIGSVYDDGENFRDRIEVVDGDTITTDLGNWISLEYYSHDASVVNYREVPKRNTYDETFTLDDGYYESFITASYLGGHDVYIYFDNQLPSNVESFDLFTLLGASGTGEMPKVNDKIDCSVVITGCLPAGRQPGEGTKDIYVNISGDITGTATVFCVDHGEAYPPDYGITEAPATYTVLTTNENTGKTTGTLFCDFDSWDKSYQNLSGTIEVQFDPPKGGFIVNKSTTCDWSKTTPGYSLDNCEFTAYYEDWTSTGVTIKTDSDGVAKSDLHALKKGNYYIKETAVSSDGHYNYNNTAVGKVTISSNVWTEVKWDNTGSGVDFSDTSCKNTPANDPANIAIQKIDAQTGQSVPEGAGNLDGAEYDFEYFADDYFTSVDPDTYKTDHASSYQRHWVMKTNESGKTGIETSYKDLLVKDKSDDFYYNAYNDVISPLGTIVVHEIKAPDDTSYSVSDAYYIYQVTYDASQSTGAKCTNYAGTDCTILIYNSTTGKYESTTYTAGTQINWIFCSANPNGKLAVNEQVLKGDIHFNKAVVATSGGTQTPLPYTPWLITSKTTGESHVVISDRNAEVDTKRVVHSQDTNKFDYIWDDGVISDDEVDAFVAYFDAGNYFGTWFAEDTELGKTSPNINDSVGAFPFDKYTLTELPCKINSSCMMLEEEFTVSQEVTPSEYIDLGTKVNQPPKFDMHTHAWCDQDGHVTKTLPLTETAHIVDKVVCDNKTSDKIQAKYVTWAVDDYGTTIVPKQYTTDYIDVGESYKLIDLYNVNTYALAVSQNNLHVYEQIYQIDGSTETLVAEHTDRFDTEQAVACPPKSTINTKLVCSADYGKIVPISDGFLVNDVITYSNFEAGKTYDVETTVKTPQGKVVGNYTYKNKLFQDANGQIEVQCDVNTMDLPEDVVYLYATEKITYGDLTMVYEDDKTNTDQSVRVERPTLKTVLLSGRDGSHNISRSESESLIDTLTYEHLNAGDKFSVLTDVINKTTGLSVYQNTSEFTSVGSGTVEVPIALNTSTLSPGDELVAYETITYNGKTMVSERDLTNANQTVKVSDDSMTTYLTVKDTTSQLISRAKQVSLVDSVFYHGLVVGQNYTYKAKLVNADGTDYVDSSSNKCSKTSTFTPTTTDGTFVIEYSTIDTSDMEEDAKIISVVGIYIGDTLIVDHSDLTDGQETVSLLLNPAVLVTTAYDTYTKSNKYWCISDERVMDTVSYSGVEAGYEYYFHTSLWSKDNQAFVTPKNAVAGTNYVETKINPGTSYGIQDIYLDVDLRDYQTDELVIFESLYDHTGALRAQEANTHNTQQTLYAQTPKFTTEMVETSTGSHTIQRYAEQSLTDSITYENFCVGKKYTLNGVLMNKATGEKYYNEVTGEPVTATYTWLPTESNGTVAKLVYTFDSTLLSDNTELVSYVEVLQDDGALINRKIIDDDKETVKVLSPTMKTQIYDTESKLQTFIACNDKSLTDDVTWTNLPLGKTVTAYSFMVNSTTGIPVTDGKITDQRAVEAISGLVDALGGKFNYYLGTYRDEETGKLVDVSHYDTVFENQYNKVDATKLGIVDTKTLKHIAFAANEMEIEKDASSGVTSNEFKFNYGITPAQDMVAITVLVSDDTTMVESLDRTDTKETMTIVRSSISTSLCDANNAKAVDVSGEGNVLLNDTIDYKDVIVGKAYKIKGDLVKKSDGSIVAHNEIELTPTATTGQIVMPFELNITDLQGENLVAYEYLYLDDDLAAQHADINDVSQTVYVNPVIPPDSPDSSVSSVKTEDIMFAVLLALGVMLIGVLAVGGVMSLRSKKLLNAVNSKQQTLNIKDE